MKITPQELAAKRARAAHLRAEIRSLQAVDVATRRDREMVVESEALDAEIEALEVKVVDAAKSSGGTVEDAKAAMERAAEIEKMMTPASDDEPNSDMALEGHDEADDTDEGEPTVWVKAPDDNVEDDNDEVPVESGEPAFGPGVVRPDLTEKEEEGSH